MKIVLKDNAELELESFNTEGSMLNLEIKNSTIDEVEERMSDENLAKVDVYTDEGEITHTVTDGTLGKNISKDRETQIIKVSIVSKEVNEAVKDHKKNIDALTTEVSDMKSVVDLQNETISDLEDILADLIGGSEE
nr:MAG TPA: Reovirus sigma C capsid protein [Caudoviricetes sp.]